MTQPLTMSRPRPAPPLPRHLVDAAELDRPLLETMLSRAAVMQQALGGVDGGIGPLRGKILATLFFEPSTRTRLSFEAAMLRLGGSVVSAPDAQAGLSTAKGESLEDTIRVVSAYADLILLRHPERGSAERAARASSVPLINAGDGIGQHPTQALLDLFTIRAELGRLDGIRVGFNGDLKHGRTVRSLALLLSNFSEIELVLISPPELRLGEDVRAELRRRGVAMREVTDLAPVAPELDVLYQTRVQRERFALEGEDARAPAIAIITPALMTLLPARAILMHPLPRVGEIDPMVDQDPRAAYFRQAAYGLPVRMAVLHWLSGLSPGV